MFKDFHNTTTFSICCCVIKSWLNNMIIDGTTHCKCFKWHNQQNVVLGESHSIFYLLIIKISYNHVKLAILFCSKTNVYMRMHAHPPRPRRNALTSPHREHIWWRLSWHWTDLSSTGKPLTESMMDKKTSYMLPIWTIFILFRWKTKDVPISGFQNISYKINIYLWIGPDKALKANERDSYREYAIKLTH